MLDLHRYSFHQLVVSDTEIYVIVCSITSGGLMTNDSAERASNYRFEGRRFETSSPVGQVQCGKHATHFWLKRAISTSC